ncbi:MAG: hypothetical protein JETT_3781 [Candidatus Jettenia ecosi]|uniref:Uncharacterized protein n=1 Tax=Candidatus Jettenia ecosi TaxID=2494326 RepID=A0A533Q5X9_9BACT|nr:MAG: hypothetical protein JETT_3781 [Candidatus Jettenia ecosi]
MIIEKTEKRIVNSEGVIWDIRLEMSSIQDLMIGCIVSGIISPLRG